MADKLPYMPFYGRDFFEDEAVALLSPAEECIVLRLLFRQWRQGSLPVERDHLQALIDKPGLGPVTDAVLALFPVSAHDGRRRNPRGEELRREHEQRSEALSEAGKRGRAKQLSGKRSRPGRGQAQAQPELPLGLADIPTAPAPPNGARTAPESSGNPGANPAPNSALGNAVGPGPGQAQARLGQPEPYPEPEPEPDTVPRRPARRAPRTKSARAAAAAHAGVTAGTTTEPGGWPAQWSKLYEPVGLLDPGHIGRYGVKVREKYGAEMADAMWADYCKYRPHVKNGVVTPDYTNYHGMGPADFKSTSGFWHSRQRPVLAQQERA